MITQEELKSLLSYDPETGEFTRIKSPRRTDRLFQTAGTKNVTGYIHIFLLGKLYLAHRLVWLYVYGSFPTKEIDHINGCKNDNKLTNLRLSTRLENSQNQVKAKGFTWSKEKNKWAVSIFTDGKYKFLGRYDTELDARAAYLRAKRELHPFSTL